MSATISYKLKNSLQGALAGGGDPATSPLYVFGPFLSLIVGAGVAQVTFGVSIWMAVFTVVSVSAMYRYVMKWITDGSGGSGLSEEEFGSWAVKINAAITVIEYTLTFLVSIAALVTFLVDRVPFLRADLGGFNVRTTIAILFSILIVLTVNRGPKIAAKFFGPATASILIFLWLMVGAVIWQRGFQLPDFNFAAFNSSHIHFTFGGFARILALMTGIEIFANLVASYEGSVAQRSRRAFGSMLIVMGTTVTTMVIVGPAILALANPLNAETSVFTQTMDALLPAWLSYAGTIIGIAVLLSAAAASAQGIQNLALGLRARHYIPAKWGQRNKFDVPSFPAWAQVGIVVLGFAFFGTHEETYLALYAAGVFILLSMTGWSAAKRFLRLQQRKKSLEHFLGILITSFAALCATFATIVIFEERFMDGAWTYLVMVPALYFGFDFYRRRLGPPPESITHRLSTVISATPLGVQSNLSMQKYGIDNILVPLSGALHAEVAFAAGLKIATQFNANLKVVHVTEESQLSAPTASTYLEQLKLDWGTSDVPLETQLLRGELTRDLLKLCESDAHDLICLSSIKLNALNRIIDESIAYKIIYRTTPPVLIFRPTDNWASRSTAFKHILVPLDGSALAEQVLPHVRAWASRYNSHITLLSIPESDGDTELIDKLKLYLNEIRTRIFGGAQDKVTCLVDGSGPARSILLQSSSLGCDLVAMVSHGRGGLGRQDFVKIGSVTQGVLTQSDIPMLFISGRNEQGQS